MKKNKILKTLWIIIIFLTSFWIWVIYSDEIKEKYVNNSEVNLLNSKSNNTIFHNYSNNVKKGEKVQYSDNFIWKIISWEKKDLELSDFWKTYNIIRNNYYDVDWLTKQELVYWAIKWLVEATWDKHSNFMTPKETKRFWEVLGWEFQWIWAVVRKNELWVEIEQVLKWAPAQKSWLRAKDIIIKAWWKDLLELDLASAVELIKWPAWTKVELVILRKWEKDFITKEVTRAKVEIPSVESEIFDDIWYIAINTFWVDTSREFTKNLEEVKKKNIKWLIIDLRDNWGWYLTSAVEILSHFIEEQKLVVSIKYRNKKEEKYFSDKFTKKENFKIIILINESSASASEITTLWLKEYNKAIIIWKKSYWKWSVQEQFAAFSDWATLKLTIAKWFSPKWNNIDKKWIDPDIEVDFEKADYDLEECKKVWKCAKDMKEVDFKLYDRQLEIAKIVLKKFIKNGFIQNTVDEYNKEHPVKKDKKIKK